MFYLPFSGVNTSPSAFGQNSHVNTYTDLPSATLHTGEYWIVDTTINKWNPFSSTRLAGIYKSNGITWVYIDSSPELSSFTDGTNSITGTNIILSGTGGTTITANSSTNTITFNSPSTSGFVPYTGATGGVDLGANTFACTGITNKGSSVLTSTSSGVIAYNTADQVTNYEKFNIGFSSNTMQLFSTFGGSGSGRNLQLGVTNSPNSSPNRVLTLNTVPAAGAGIFDFTNTLTSIVGSLTSLNGAFQGSSVAQSAFQISNTVNQSSTATFKGLYITPYLQATGASTYLIDAGTNTATANGGTHTSKFSVDSNGNVVTGSTATAGHTFYNTADQVTNYEKLQASFASNVFNMSTTAGGTGTVRPIQVLSNNSVGITCDYNASLLSIASKINLGFGSSGTSGGAGLVSITGTTTSAANVQSPFGICPTVNQSGTGGVNTLYISPYLQAQGSGGSYLINAGTNSAANGSGTHTPVFQVDVNGTVFSASTYTAVASNTATGLKPRSTYTTSGTGVKLSDAVTYSASSGNTYAVAITATWNTSGTAATTDLLINRTNTTVGSGTNYLIDCQVGGVSKFNVDTAGNLQAVTSIWHSQANTSMYINPSNYTSANSGNNLTIGSNTTNINTQGQINVVAIIPTYNQASGTSANTDLLVNRTQTAVGSGAQLLMDLQVGGVSKHSVSNTGLINVPSAITATTVGAAGGASTLPLTPVGYLQISVGGTTYKIPYYNN